jgi:4-diphosphocytidyl-2-C-methyl-D-erythritol kinase
MRLEKRIPMGGGLGGGSSNAAAVLRALPALLGKRADPQLLLRVGASLGSDVPFFLLGGTALAMGRGEELYPFAEPPQSYGVLVLPGLHVSTPEAYKSLARTAEPRPDAIAAFAVQSWPIRSWMPLSQWDGFCANDFEPAVFAMYPSIGRLRQRLERMGARPARMTGSGSTVFGFFPTKAAAHEAATRIPGAIAFATVSRRRYETLWAKALAG